MSFSKSLSERASAAPVLRYGRRATQALVAVCLIGLAAIVLAGPAAAAPATNSQVVPVESSEIDLGGFQLKAPIFFPDPLPIALTDLTVNAKAKWTGNLTTNVGWDSDKVRQGADLSVNRAAPLTDGKIDVKWQVTGKADGISFGPVTISADNVDCAPKLSGGGLGCVATSGGIGLPGGIPLPQGWIVAKLAINVTFDVTPEGAVVSRGFSIGGNQVAGPDDLSLTEAGQTESLKVPCTAKAGDAVDYKLDPFHWTPKTTASQQFTIRLVDSLDPDGIVELFEYKSFGIGSAQVSNPSFDVTGSGFITSMGPLLANNVKPTIVPLSSFSGQEGSPISFSASVDSQCPIESYVWDFSNGTKSFGPTPQRAFGDNGVYDGQLTVTDVTGLSATQSFTVSVSNVKPSVDAGPDTTSDWGRSVQFNGQATDPGSGDQGTLQYTWTFGDDSPSASGGPSVLHSYATPGDYAATLKVCDKDGGCDTDTRTVHVTKRDTTLGYTGPTYSAPSKTVTLTANLVDAYGQPVAGKKVTFALGAQTATGTTDASGKATADIKLTQKPGSYALSATFPTGDAKYSNASDSGSFVIGK
jgi:PKD domain/Bacterial Ig-like domain (group 1)